MRDFDYTPFDAQTLNNLKTEPMQRDARAAVQMLKVAGLDSKTAKALEKRLVEAVKLMTDGRAMLNAGIQFLAEFERQGGFKDGQSGYQQTANLLDIFIKAMDRIAKKGIEQLEERRRKQMDEMRKLFLAAMMAAPGTVKSGCKYHAEGKPCPFHGAPPAAIAPSKSPTVEAAQLADDEDDTEDYEDDAPSAPVIKPDTITTTRYSRENYQAVFTGFNHVSRQQQTVKGGEASSMNFAIAALFDELDRQGIRTDTDVKFVYLAAGTPAGR